jgi:ribosome modulation factor
METSQDTQHSTGETTESGGLCGADKRSTVRFIRRGGGGKDNDGRELVAYMRGYYRGVAGLSDKTSMYRMGSETRKEWNLGHRAGLAMRQGESPVNTAVPPIEQISTEVIVNVLEIRQKILRRKILHISRSETYTQQRLRKIAEEHERARG